MKSQHQLFVIAALTLVGILAGCESQMKTQAQAQTQVLAVAQQSGRMQHDNDAAMRKATTTKEWQALKESADEQINENGIQIVSLNLPIKKKLALEHRNRDLQFRIDTYPKSNSEWELFRRAFNNDMQELRVALEELLAVSR